ncbi:hypothetical protein CU097_007622 [Rhizopus azygosporus]|uniref:Uncharacterized protein n=1 Tax=Rhizopus azygosporus TaxID=86630 RepID=A0A367JA44_RHIAZ|nr:hypothetical protein CU097_007622 [Rhizopus azygosporus]
MALTTVPVPRPPVRPQPVPLDLYQGHQTFTTMGQAAGSDNTGICEDGPIGVVGQRQKIHSNPLSADYSLEYDDRHGINDHFRTRQENSIDLTNGLQTSLPAIDDMDTTRSIHWNDDGDSTGEHSSTFSHPTPTAAVQQILTICNITFNNTESSLSYHSSNKTRIYLMDFATAAMEWLAYPSAHSRTGWGIVCGNRRFSGLWSSQERRFHINYKEFLAVDKALKQVPPSHSGHI